MKGEHSWLVHVLDDYLYQQGLTDLKDWSIEDILSCITGLSERQRQWFETYNDVWEIISKKELAQCK